MKCGAPLGSPAFRFSRSGYVGRLIRRRSRLAKPRPSSMSRPTAPPPPPPPPPEELLLELPLEDELEEEELLLEELELPLDEDDELLDDEELLDTPELELLLEEDEPLLELEELEEELLELPPEELLPLSEQVLGSAVVVGV